MAKAEATVEELVSKIERRELLFWKAGDALDVQGQLQAQDATSGRPTLPWRYRWPDAVRDEVRDEVLAR